MESTGPGAGILAVGVLMNVLLAGAFGSVGQSTIEALLERGHRVRAFDIATRANQKAALGYTKRIEIYWGDLRRPDDLGPRCRRA